nr:MAG TPA: hypothetical protein [Caudoviricetes sp.]
MSNNRQDFFCVFIITSNCFCDQQKLRLVNYFEIFFVYA